ncbi:MAG: IS1182 family transposase [Crocinitomicaceae bacterium]
MKYIKGNDRHQTALIPSSLEELIDEDNEIRIIDLFVDSLNLADMDFRLDFGENGRPAYHPSDLLKLYLYGYLNKVRSSRDLEKACHINVEVMWLMKSLAPDHNTISNFRRDNKKGIKKVFRSAVELAKNFDLIGGKLIAGDSTKLRAQNSKKKNYNKKKIDRQLDYIDARLSHYNKLLEEADGDNKKIIQEKIDKHNKRKDDYDQMNKTIEASDEVQISTSDPDSRNIIIRNGITEVCYCIQTTVDAHYNIPIDYKTTNKNDAKAMGPMLKRAVEIIGHNKFTALYDKGYHTGSELKTAVELGINAIVSAPDLASTSRAPSEAYNVQHFEYDSKKDLYICPEGEELTTSQSWYTNTRTRTKFKQYKTKACLSCKVKSICTKSKTGKLISRSDHQQYYEANKKKLEENMPLYRRRQAIVEHPYGTIKRYWGFSYIVTKKGVGRAAADVGLMFTAYTLKRIINILDPKILKAYLKKLVLLFYSKKATQRSILSYISTFIPIDYILPIKLKIA